MIEQILAGINKQVEQYKDDYTAIDNAVIQHSKISIQALGMYAFLKFHHNGWYFTLESIAKEQNCSYGFVKKCIDELMELSLLKRIEPSSRNEKGHKQSCYILYDSYTSANNEIRKEYEQKILAEKPTTQIMGAGIENNPSHKNPTLENQGVGEPTAENIGVGKNPQNADFERLSGENSKNQKNIKALNKYNIINNNINVNSNKNILESREEYIICATSQKTNENGNKTKIKTIEVPLFENKRMTKEQKFIKAIEDYRSLKESEPNLPISEELWGEWCEMFIENNARKPKLNKILFKQLKDTIKYPKEFVESQFQRGLSAGWISPYLDDRNFQMWQRDMKVAEKLAEDDKNNKKVVFRPFDPNLLPEECRDREFMF